MEFEDLEELHECDYEYWMKHDLLTIVQISFIACGNKPLSDYRIFFQHQDYYPKQNKIYNLLVSGLEANKIKTNNQDDVSAKAPPLEWLTYLKNKDCSLPFYLNDVLFDVFLSSMPENQDVPAKRSKDSYQNKEIRGDEPVLKAVIRTLLDLYPELPKIELIQLRPIKQYANGDAHADESLMEIITQLEGGKRKPGRPLNQKLEEIKRDIPRQWLMPKKES
jgi:hypothetical protein